MLRLSGLYRFPLKSGAGESVPRAELDALGLAGDRRWMIVDEGNGRFLTQRLLPQMTQLQARWQGSDGLLLRAPGQSDLWVPLPDSHSALRWVTVWRDSLNVPDAGDVAAAWLSAFLGRSCRLVQVPPERARQINTSYAELGERVGFADGFPLLLVGQSSLDELSAQVGRPLERLRFRPNLVVEGGEPYAEDSWRRIRIGNLSFKVAKGCSRCIITTLDPATGERSRDGEPLKTLRRYRQSEGEVYFGQNLIAQGVGELALGMPVQVLE